MDDRVKAAEALDFEGLSRAVRAGLVFRRLTRRPDPIKVIQHRERVRDVLHARLPKPSPGHWPEVVVIQAAKASQYPVLKPKILDLTPPSWMKLEIKRLADDALEVGLEFVRVRIQGLQARPVEREAGEGEGQRVLIVGRLPYEKIAHIDWVGDPAYSSPRLYTYFRWRWPYKAIEVHKHVGDGEYFAMHGVTYKDTRFSRFERLRLNWELRNNQLGDPGDYDDP